MKLKAVKGYSILEYQAPDDWTDATGKGIILPSASTMRDMLRKSGSKTFDINDIPPDVYRFGRLVDGNLDIPIGSFVYYNKHDAEEFEVEKQTYYRINNLNAIAYYVIPPVEAETNTADFAAAA